MKGIFRREALLFQQHKWGGNVSIASPMSRWVLVSGTFFFAALALLFLANGHYTRRESVSGVLIPMKGIFRVTSYSQGVIEHVLVHEGDHVKVGDAVLELSNEHSSVSAGATYKLLGDELIRQSALLRSDAARIQQKAAHAKISLKQKIALMQLQAKEIDAQIQVQSQQVSSASGMRDRIRPLMASGYVSAIQFQQQEAAVLDAEIKYKALKTQRLIVSSQLNDCELELQESSSGAETDSADIERRLSEISKAAIENEARRATVMRAPIDGTVGSILVKDGESIQSGQSLASLLPMEQQLIAQVLVPSRAIGFVEQGSRVLLRYDAFPYQKFGTFEGEVVNVSRNTLSAPELAKAMGDGTTSRDPMFLVEVALSEQSVSVGDGQRSLKSGMSVKADIETEQRSLFEWVFESLYGLHNSGVAKKRG